MTPPVPARPAGRILALDTSTWICSVALVRGATVLAERVERAEASHAETLPRLVEAVLAAAGERPARDDAVAVAIGPGSFTGLRIGLSFAKGLAFSGGLRIVGIPTLDALALAVPAWTGRLATVLDARKQEVYAAVYERVEGRIVRLGAPGSITAARLAAAIAGPCTFVGDGVAAYGQVFREYLGPGVVCFEGVDGLSRARAVARLAAARLARQPEGDDLVTLAPVYIRPPEAELRQSTVAPSAAAIGPSFVDKVPLVY